MRRACTRSKLRVYWFGTNYALTGLVNYHQVAEVGKVLLKLRVPSASWRPGLASLRLGGKNSKA